MTQTVDFIPESRSANPSQLKLPSRYKLTPIYDLVISRNQWEWYGPEFGFLPRVATLTRSSGNYSANREQSISALGKHFIDVDKLPNDLLDECIKKYHIGTNSNCEKLYHYANIGEKFYSDSGNVHSVVDRKIYGKFVTAVCKQFKIELHPDLEYVKAELMNLSKTILDYKLKEHKGLRQEKAVTAIAAITATMDEIVAWSQSNMKLLTCKKVIHPWLFAATT